MFQETKNVPIQAKRTPALSSVKGNLVPNRVSCAQEFQRAVVRENRVFPNRNCRQKQIWVELSRLDMRRDDSVDLACHQLQSTLFKMMFQALHGPSAPARRI
jgi:hypothetical protein